MAFNENTRVKIPAILHLARLGYTYLPLNQCSWNESTNIFFKIFSESLSRLNPTIEQDEIARILKELELTLDFDDLGQSFFEAISTRTGAKIIDFDNFSNNTFNVVTELTYRKGDDSFRPDITILINGLPLIFIEVKKPNNQDGILAERKRINSRFRNQQFKRFINLTQLLIFTNNMEYDSESIEPLQGAFYATPAYGDVYFNCFREEETFDLTSLLKPESDEIENLILKDNNLSSIKFSPEFIQNKLPHSPTNRILTSLVSKDRLRELLMYGFAYVNGVNGIEKHVMRYQQLFATKAIQRKLVSGLKKGIIWHTQGSGKTALAYYNVHTLTDYYYNAGITPKFYFIVDRLDLLIQAEQEFTSRGLVVHTVDSKDELLADFKLQQVIHNHSGKREITVVNIQKFKDDLSFLREQDYNISVQRIYFLDEVHRSYDPKGSFLANLYSSDRSAVLIGLTGTPLISADKRSRDTFGDYIHKYYYNSSIADGYTLRLLREGIETRYKMQLNQALAEIEVLVGDIDRRELYAHKRFDTPMLEYILTDFTQSRVRFNDYTIGAMVVCDSSDQAKMMYEVFTEKMGDPTTPTPKLTAALILHDVGDKKIRKEQVDDFKAGKIDFLFVYNMLLTGFDAKRLKKLYLGRKIKSHNLLQTLTRVNRPYKKFRYGFVVDFADIREEFDATNKAYFQELQDELDDELATYSSLFKAKEEIEQEISTIEEKLFQYDLQNAEVFSQQISQIQDKPTVSSIKKALENARELYNLIRLQGHFELLERLDFKKLRDLLGEVSRHLDLLNLRESLKTGSDTTGLLNTALEDVLFMFKKVSEEEMVIADQLKDLLRRTREAMAGNLDKQDPEYIKLYEEITRLFKEDQLGEVNQGEMKIHIAQLERIYEQISALNRANANLETKYDGDQKYMRIHKRIKEHGLISELETKINAVLAAVKVDLDEKLLKNSQLLENEGYYSRLSMQTLLSHFEEQDLYINPEVAEQVNNWMVREYTEEYKGDF